MVENALDSGEIFGTTSATKKVHRSFSMMRFEGDIACTEET
jgi:hypothetical protein